MVMPRSSISRASTRCVMVAPTWLLMSSPTIGSLASVNFCAHSGSRRDEHGDRVHEADARFEARGRVEALRLLRPDGEVAHEHVGLGVAEHLHDVDGLGRRLLDGLAVVLAEAVERRCAEHLDPEGTRRSRT